MKDRAIAASEALPASARLRFVWTHNQSNCLALFYIRSDAARILITDRRIYACPVAIRPDARDRCGSPHPYEEAMLPARRTAFIRSQRGHAMGREAEMEARSSRHICRR